MFQEEAPPPKDETLSGLGVSGGKNNINDSYYILQNNNNVNHMKILRPFFFPQVLRRELNTGCFSWELFTYPFSVLQLGDAVIELELLAGWATTLHCGHRSPPPPHYNPSRAPKMSSLGHHQLVFQTAKKSLTSAPTLAFFDQATAIHRC